MSSKSCFELEILEVLVCWDLRNFFESAAPLLAWGDPMCGVAVPVSAKKDNADVCCWHKFRHYTGTTTVHQHLWPLKSHFQFIFDDFHHLPPPHLISWTCPSSSILGQTPTRTNKTATIHRETDAKHSSPQDKPPKQKILTTVLIDTLPSAH